jgi:VTC domain
VCDARWYGTEATDTVTLERRSHATGNDADTQALQLPERFVVPFLTGTLAEKDYIRNLRSIQVSSASQEEACRQSRAQHRCCSWPRTRDITTGSTPAFLRGVRVRAAHQQYTAQQPQVNECADQLCATSTCLYAAADMRVHFVPLSDATAWCSAGDEWGGG